MYLLIPAAGSGRRMGAEKNKLLLTVQGQPILSWTLKAADQAQSITAIGIIGQPQDQSAWIELLDHLQLSTPVSLIPGGATRQESVYRGVIYLQQQPQPPEFVLIHDGARCLATAQLFDRCSAFLQHLGSPHQGMVAAIPVKDTIKLATPADSSTGSLRVESTPDRSRLWAAQTPQGFQLDALLKAHDQAIQEGWEVTDDAALFEKMGWEVAIVEGEETNIKLTTPLDKLLAERILAERGLLT
ncbi:MAG: 2-C-methyl-D-erythritol 4-phosphate cytidylyltransferase [Cyanophyceae cyanobacterium]